MNRVYEAWIIHDDSGETYGSYDWRNGGFDNAVYICSYLNENNPGIYSFVQVLGTKG